MCRGGNQISYSEVLARAAYARDLAGGAPYGLMLWSLHKNDGCPNAQQITQAACTTYNLGNCNTPLPVPVTPNCPGVTPSPPPPPVVTPSPPPPAVTASPPPPPVVTPSPPPPPTGVTMTLPSGPLNVVYYQTWSAAMNGASLDLAQIPGRAAFI
jgi:hypothetical protein